MKGTVGELKDNFVAMKDHVDILKEDFDKKKDRGTM